MVVLHEIVLLDRHLLAVDHDPAKKKYQTLIFKQNPSILLNSLNKLKNSLSERVVENVDDLVRLLGPSIIDSDHKS